MEGTLMTGWGGGEGCRAQAHDAASSQALRGV